MKAKVGLWIDDSKAVILAFTKQGEDIGVIISKAEKRIRRSSDSALKGFESRQLPVDESRQRVFTGHRNAYYGKVIAKIQDAQSILILGPDGAKGELKKRLEKNNFGGRIEGIKTADKMTDRQIAAKVRLHFKN